MFTSARQLNDPFEFRWHEVYPNESTELDRFVREICRKTYPYDSVEQRRVHYQHLLSQLKEYAARGGGRSPTVAKFNMGVFSASEVNDNIQMWSHYADHHKGICVGVRPDAIPRRFLRVEYYEQVPVLNIWEYINPTQGVFVRLSLSKAVDWNYEREWRTIYKAGPQRYTGCVDHVIIGARATATTRAAVRQTVEESKQPITVLEARLSDKKYALVIAEECNLDSEIVPAEKRAGKNSRHHRGKGMLSP
jgi:hypothetical protein